MLKIINYLSRIFKKSPKRLSNVIGKRYDEEYEGWLGV